MLVVRRTNVPLHSFGGAPLGPSSLPIVSCNVIHFSISSCMYFLSLLRARLLCRLEMLHRRCCYPATVVEDWLGAINSFDGVYSCFFLRMNCWKLFRRPLPDNGIVRLFLIAAALRTMSLHIYSQSVIHGSLSTTSHQCFGYSFPVLASTPTAK